MNEKCWVFQIGGERIQVEAQGSSFIPGNYLPFATTQNPTRFLKFGFIKHDFVALHQDDESRISVGRSNDGIETMQFQAFGTAPAVFLQMRDSFSCLHNFGESQLAHPAHKFPCPAIFVHAMVHFLHGRGVFLHGACGSFEDQGFIFCGQSGSGKTTAARKWQNYGRSMKIFGDERSVISKSGDSFHVYSSPWPGELNLVTNESAFLRYLFVLRSTGPSIEPISKFSQFLGAMMPLTYQHSWNVAFTQFLIDFFGEMHNNIRCFFVNRLSVTEPEHFFSLLKHKANY